MADLDNLKTLNDSGGHHSGDRALRSLATVLSQAARGSDVVGRLGGDEFAMLLHETDEDAALAVAVRLRDALESTAGSGLVTASLGVSTWLGHADRPEDLLRRADEALYMAKRAGRTARVGATGRGGPGGTPVARPAPAPGRGVDRGLNGARGAVGGREAVVAGVYPSGSPKPCRMETAVASSRSGWA